MNKSNRYDRTCTSWLKATSSTFDSSEHLNHMYKGSNINSVIFYPV